MTDITIPPEAVEAAAIDLYRAMYPEPNYHSWSKTPEWMRELKRRYVRAACLAMLKAWPGMWTSASVGNGSIILPLTENIDE